MIKLTDLLLETLLEKKLCPKGRAYYNRRIAAGEKPSAYLSGRAVKVCKGLMEDNHDELNELRKSLIDYLREKLPSTPEYIIKDFFYNNLKDATQKDVEDMLKEYSGVKWELKKDFPINLNTFDEETIRRIKEREGGSKNPYSVPKDEERHKTQKELILKKGLPQEPIILLKKGNKYELVEGWHRTIQLLNLFPEGYKYPNVYIGTKSLNENIDPAEAYTNRDSVQTIIDGKRDIAFVVEKGDTPDNWKVVTQMVADNGLKSVYVKGNPSHAYVVYRPGAEQIAMELKDIAEKYKGYLASNATAEDTRRIGQLLGYDEDKIEQFIKDRYIDEGLEDTSWTGKDGQKITLQQLLDATKNYPITQAPIEKVEKIVIKKDSGGIESDRLSAADVKYPIIIVVDDSNNFKYILDGNHRANKAIAAGLKSIPAKLVNIKKLPQEFQDVLGESLRDWFKKEDWVRIDTQGNITGPCGTMKKGKATTRCLPRAKANSLTKAERAATARKKVAGSKKGKQFVPNTEKAKVRFKK